MPVGLQTWDDSGKILVDLTTRLARYMGYVDVAAGQSGSLGVTVPQGTSFFFQVIPLETMTPYRIPADVKYENGVMMWDFITGYGPQWKRVNSRIIYGYY